MIELCKECKEKLVNTSSFVSFLSGYCHKYAKKISDEVSKEITRIRLKVEKWEATGNE